MITTSDQAAAHVSQYDRRPRWRLHHAYLAVVAVAGITASWFICHAIDTTGQSREQERVAAIARSVTDQVNIEMARSIEALRGASLMVATRQSLLRSEFVEYGRHLVELSQIITSLDWHPLVPAAEISSFEAAAWAQGLDGFRVLELGDTGLVQANYRGHYFPLLFSYPEGSSFTGVDLASDPAHQESVRLPLPKKPFASEATPCPTPCDPAKGNVNFSISAAVYRLEPTKTQPARQPDLLGYIKVGLNAHQLLQSAAAVANAAQFDLLVFDQTSSRKTLISKYLGKGSDLAANIDANYRPVAHDVAATANIGTRTWELVVHPHPALSPGPLQVGQMAFLGGSLLSALLTLALYLALRNQRRIELAQAATRNALQALAIERLRLNNVVECTRAGTWEWNVQTQEIRLNERCASMLGYSLDDISPYSFQTWRAFSHPDDLSQSEKLLNEHLANGVGFYVSAARMHHKQGHWIWVLTRGRLISRTPQNQPEWMAGIHLDISAQINAHDATYGIISTICEELHTPITSINGALGLIIGGALGDIPPQAKQLLSMAHKNCQGLTRLANDLQDIEQLNDGETPLDFQTTALMPIVEATLGSMHQCAEKYQVQFVIKKFNAGVKVNVDQARLQDVLTIYLATAAKFSPPGGEISINVIAKGENVRVEVVDQGAPIPTEFQGRFFQRFAPSDTTELEPKERPGLGLILSKELIERMNGRVGWTSHNEQDVCFYFEIPVAPTAEKVAIASLV